MASRIRAQSPLLVGRDDLLALLERRAAEAKAGRGNLVMLAGEAGIGKTRLLKAAIRQAVGSGFRYAKGDLAPQDQLVGLASVRDLARSMASSDFGKLGPELLEMRGGKGRDSLASRRILVHEIAEQIMDAIDRPTLLAFEDLQWADELTLEVIGDLARLGRERPLFLLAAYRLDELPIGSIHREWRSRLVTQRLAEEVRLERLSLADTALVASLVMDTGLPVAREVAAAVHKRTNGIPLHIEELIAAVGTDLPSDGRSVREASVPDTIEDAVLARTRHLSDGAREVALAGAVIGRCFAPDVLAGILDRPVADLDAPLQELVDHAVLFPFHFVDEGYFDFRHQLLRDALYGSVPAPELRRLHARAAEFGATLVGATDVHASLHFERAGLRDEAFRAALSGARAAASMTSRFESFELYRRAVANMPTDLPDAERGGILLEYADAASAMDNVAVMEQVATEARRHLSHGVDPLGEARALMLLYSASRRDVRPRSEQERTIRDVEAALAKAPPSPDRDRLLAETHVSRAFLALDAGRPDLAEAETGRMADLLRDLGDPDLDVRYINGMTATVSGRAKVGLGAMLEVARGARDGRLESTGVTAYRSIADLAIRVMDYPAAEIGLGEGMRFADEIEQSYCRRNMAASSAHLAWASGRWDEAIRIAELELVGPGSRRAQLAARDALAFVAFGRGAVARVRDLADTSLAVARPSGAIDLILPSLWALGEAALVDGDPSRAQAHCQEAYELVAPTRGRAGLVPFIVTGTRAAIAVRRPEEAELWLSRCTEALADWADLATPALAHGDGLVRLASGSLVAARTALETAVAGWDARGRIWEATWARIDLATALLRSNRYAEAAKLFAEVAVIAERLASPPLRARADELGRQARGRTPEGEVWHPLTIREFEVARRVASGMTNAEIAAELFLSPKTVSAHVEHILAKLGANRRAEIASWAATVAQPSS